MIYFYLFLSLSTSFAITAFIIPIIIKVSVKKKLFDVPNLRSAAKHVVPTLGGIAIFTGFRISQIISLNSFEVNELKYMSLGILTMFILGLKDDLIALSAKTKFVVQLAVALYLVILGNNIITNFHGILGIYEISNVAGTIFSVIVIVGIINAMNLIDGIDGLASGIGLLISLVYGIWFFNAGDYIFALTSFCLFGSLLAFFLYNVFGTANKIFMGDTGSLILGTILALLTIHFNEFKSSPSIAHGHPAISLAIIIVPVIDTIRIFVIRLLQRKSPFSPDMNHIHHQVLRLTNSHIKATLIIVAVNAVFIFLAFNLLDVIGNNMLFLLLLVLGFILAEIPLWILKIKNKKEQAAEIDVYNEGRIVHVKAYGSFDQDNTINEITESKNTNEALEENELLFSLLAESAPVGIFMTDAFGTTNYVNPRWCEISQISFDEAMGDGWLKAVHPEDRDNLSFGWQHAAQDNTSSMADYRFIHTDGSVKWVIGQAVPLKNKAGNNIGYLGTITDITERKKMEVDLILLKAKAEESDQLKTAFLNNMSHEIRTPLNGIMGFSQLLKDDNLTSENKRKYIAIIEKCSDQLHNIINNIIDISKIELGQIKISISEINIEEEIRFIYKFFNDDIKQKGLQLSVTNSLNSNNRLIRTDREKLIAILTNLVKNAVKYTEEGSIEIGCGMRNLNITNAGTNNIPDDFVFFVKDTGIGIRKDRQKDIFERFIQADVIDKKARQGAGLGLAISRAFAEMLGGKIWVDSEEGKGSTFYFTLPHYTEPVDKQSMNKFNIQLKNTKSAS
ncbi:MAG: hypothetical protein A2066_04180 [Bacteroidetes bacterium GWB2_41_8]|nr:MAG: hypothetical protein A2066_04180 [Bacteroidetes bacterium GWB2_41_8]